MTFAELLASVQGRDYPLLDDVVRESRARQQAIEQRALRVREVLPMSPETARRVALFSLGGWAQNIPAAPHDLGESAALYIAKQLIVRNLGTDSMHNALLAWRWRSIGDRLESRVVLDVRTIAEIAGTPTASTVRLQPVSQQPNRLARRAAASRRSR